MATRYAAFLRGVSPMNATMPALKAAFEAAGFDDVKTVLGTGNVLFSARASAERTIARKAEAAMMKALGRTFATFVRPVDALREMIATDPWTALRVPAGAKRIVSFLHADPKPMLAFPLVRDGSTLYALRDRALLGAYLPDPRGPIFMALIDKHFGAEVTTRTWDTVVKVTR